VTGSQLRPHIVFFGEELNSQDLLSANNAAKDADVCIVVGTSMQVAPANLIPFLTKETALIYYVDPGNMGFSIPYNRESLFQHYKEIASVGMKKVYDDLIEIFLEK
jgi:NAD-dependent deacetylase